MRLVARRAAVLLLALLGLTPALLAGLSQGVGASSLGSYQAAVLSDAPVGYWRLGERSGAVAADSSGAGRSGSYSGGVSLGVAGALVGDGDTSVSFDGSSGRVSVPDAVPLRLSGAFSVEFWGRLDAFVNSYPGLLGKGLSSGPDGFLVWYGSDGALSFKRNGVEFRTPAGAFVTGRFRHFAVTYDGASVRWYVDGAQVASKSVVYPTSAGTAPLVLGQGDQPGRQTLDEVALYDRALTAQQVSAHRSAGLTAPSPSPSPSSAASATAAPSTSPSSTGSPFVSPVIAAAGDVACDPTDPNYNGGQGTANFCHMQATGSLLSARPYAAVLPLGDAQYTDGTTSKFAASFQSAWGGSKSLMRPVPGNHEYLSNAAQGYYSYFGAQAGDPKQGWYSYDLGSWHVIALNGECGQVGGCGAGSPQESWLRADLAAHPAACTLAYWHEPLFTSSEPNYTAYRPFWDDLYAARADVVLNGHVHNYERFAPQDPSGVADAAGVREFIVGTGGKDLVGFGTPLATSEVRSASAYGALELTLNQGSYSWHFAPEAGQTFTDAGSTACH